MSKDFVSTQIDIVLPCYNPGNQWLYELEQFHELAKHEYLLNYIIVNDGSIGHNIASQIQSLKQKHIQVQLIDYQVNKGKGHALRTGVMQSKADYIVYTDIDFPFTNQSVMSLIKELVSNQNDVVVGFRNDHYYQKKMSWFRKNLSTTFRLFIRKFLRMRITDTQCGLKGFNQKGKQIFLSTTINRYLFDFEFIYKVSNEPACKIIAVEVQLKENVKFSKMRLKILLQETYNLFKILVSSR